MQTTEAQKILVPVDYSDTSLNALDVALAMSRRQSADIRLVHVVDPNQYIFISGGGLVIDFSQESILKAETEKLQKLADSLSTNQETAWSVECRTGNVHAGIVEAAQAYGADFIVMGSHGTSGIREYFMGSEAYRVIKTAPCPVLTVPNRQKWNEFRKIIFPVRPVPGALDKYDVARKIIRKNKAQLTVLGLIDQADEQTIDALTRSITTLNGQLAADGIDGQTELLETDNVAGTVLAKAREQQADLIIITADLDTTVDYFFVGPFVQQIVNHANVPILSIRPQPPVTLRMQPAQAAHTPLLPTMSSSLLPPFQLG